MAILDITELTVYDPGEDGSAAEFVRLLRESPDQAGQAEQEMYSHLLASPVGKTTLEDWLFGENGYFDGNPFVVAVRFRNGAFHLKEGLLDYKSERPNSVASKVDPNNLVLRLVVEERVPAAMAAQSRLETAFSYTFASALLSEDKERRELSGSDPLLNLLSGI